MRLAFTLICSLAFVACDDNGNTSFTNGVPSGKSDNFAESPLQELELDENMPGDAAGTAVSLYAFEVRPGALIQVEAHRESGNLSPVVYLYKDIQAVGSGEYTVPNAGFNKTATSLRAGWQLEDNTGSGIIVVGAGRDTSGQFALTLKCHPDASESCSLEDYDPMTALCRQVSDAYQMCFEAMIETCDDWMRYEDNGDVDSCCRWLREQGENDPYTEHDCPL